VWDLVFHEVRAQGHCEIVPGHALRSPSPEPIVNRFIHILLRYLNEFMKRIREIKRSGLALGSVSQSNFTFVWVSPVAFLDWPYSI
jgi:hypothetical protein